jgi:hypothetical protein
VTQADRWAQPLLEQLGVTKAKLEPTGPAVDFHSCQNRPKTSANPSKDEANRLFSPSFPESFQQRRCVASANRSWHMASWIEIDRVRKDPKAFKLLAGHLLADADYARERSEFATDFLENISRFDREELSTRQSEILLELRDEGRRHFKIGDGLSVEILIEKCFLARLDLGSDDDIGRIEALKASGRTFVTGKEIGWFKRICKELGELEPYV